METFLDKVRGSLSIAGRPVYENFVDDMCEHYAAICDMGL